MSVSGKFIYKALQLAKIKGTCGRTLKTGIDKAAKMYPSKFNRRGLTMTVEGFEGRNVVVLKKKGMASKRYVIYLHGGGYVCQSSSLHWAFVTDLARRTGIEIHCPDYPLAPAFHSGEALDFVYRYYLHHLKTFSPDSIVLMGDSAGAGLALSLLMMIRNEGKRMPDKGILISPFLDTELSDDRQLTIDPLDPLLSVDGLRACGKAYVGNLSLEDWRVNPIKGDFKGLCPLSVFTGDVDILHIDALRLKEKLEVLNQPYTFYFEEGMLHDWVLFPGLPEAKKARKMIVKDVC